MIGGELEKQLPVGFLGELSRVKLGTSFLLHVGLADIGL